MTGFTKNTCLAAIALIAVGGLAVAQVPAPQKNADIAELKNELRSVKQALAAAESRLREIQQVMTVKDRIVTIQGLRVTISGAAAVDVKSGGLLSLDGKLVKLGGGGKPVARIGSKVGGPPGAHLGTVIDGASTVLVP